MIPGAYQPGTMPGDRALDGPPPSSAQSTNGSTGVPPQPGRPGSGIAGSGVAGGGIGAMGVPPLDVQSHAMPPEVLTGILQAGESISKMLDSFAQVTPDLAADWAACKNALLSAMAKVLQAGAGPTSPVAPGPQFPGGGLDRGGGPPALG